MHAEEIVKLIKESKKKTPTKAFVSGELSGCEWKDVIFIGNDTLGLIVGDHKAVRLAMDDNAPKIKASHIEVEARNSAVPLADLTQYDARIEPGAVIRDMTEIGSGAVIMMGAVINIGAVIGAKTMVDMNAVIGGRAEVGANCHIGAGAVVAGVIEPLSAVPVVIEDNVLVGANAVILEGVRVGEGAVIAAGAIVTKDVPAGAVAAGSPARIIKMVDAKTADKTRIVQDLRNL